MKHVIVSTGVSAGVAGSSRAVGERSSAPMAPPPLAASQTRWRGLVCEAAIGDGGGAILAILLLAILPTLARAGNDKLIPLFDGKSLTGWHQAGPPGFDLKDGILTAHGGMGLLWNDRELGDFILRLEFQVSKKEDNSGVFVRFPDPGNDPWIAVNQGHEIQICDTEANNRTGAIYNFKDASELATKPVGEWNAMEIKVVGRSYTVTINKKVVNEYTSTTRPLRGHIGLQNHWGAVSFRNITVEELTGGAAAVAAGQPVSLKDASPGLVGEYFENIAGFKALTQVKQREPFFLRVDPQINFAAVEGEFYGSHLIENFGVRWTGAIHIDKPGTYTFDLRSDDGSKLTINGKTVVDHSRAHGMEDKAGQVRFTTAGDYPLKLEYNQFASAAGCIFNWQPPNEKDLSVVPASVLVHEKSAEDIQWNQADWKLAQTDHRAWIKKHGRKFEKMDYGPFLAGTFVAPQPKDNTTLKGIIVKLNDEGTANVLFDTELMRYSAGWTGDFIDYHGVAYDGAHGVDPKIKGEQVFGTPSTPGWEHEGAWNDPRSTPYGPLPHEWAHYKGLYRNADRVIFSYTINGSDVLEMPHAESHDGAMMFVRSFQIGPCKSPLTMLVCQQPSAANQVEVFGTSNLKIATDSSGRVTATFPPQDATASYQVSISSARRQTPAKMVEIVQQVGGSPLDSLCKGGPRLWGEPIVTQGALGSGDGPYVVDTITSPENNPYDAWMRLGGFDFFPDGHRAAVCTWNGDVWIVSGIDDSLQHLTWQRFATGLFQSLGLKIVNNEIYVLGRDQITRLHDLNGDGEADFYENFNNDCQVSPGFHEFAHDLQVDSQGNFYYAKGGPVNSGGRGFEKLTDHAGTIRKVSPDGKTSETFATGVRAPNGMSMGPHDEITVSDNQGTWVPACRISFVTRGAFLGVPDTAHLDPKPTNYGNPICWFPYVEGDYTTGDNSSGGAAWAPLDDTKWGPFAGQPIHLSYGTCSLFKLMYENVDGVWQGGVVRFPLDFDSGIMRARFNPVDGQLYVCGLKGWQTRATKDGIFQRVRYTGKTVTIPTELHVSGDSVSVVFTNPVDPESARDSGNYDVEQWNYIWSDDYGSPEVSRDDPKKKGRDTVDIDSIEIGKDNRTVRLKIADLKPVMQMKIKMKIKAADGTPLDYEIDSTINKIPGGPSIATPQPPAEAHAALK
ncbi:MAG TPA: family 16 glycoside hydrolase [Tepidisphaeraceae bacterium]|nr:family 16 glycoside hydrolase [Tepidisphaeraceae bacterium]